MLRLGVALLIAVSAGIAQKTDSLYGDWRVTAVAGAGPVTAISGGAAARLVGQVLLLKPNSLRFAGESCRPTYETTSESAADFAADYKTDLRSLKLPAPVTRFDADCTDLFISAPNRIVFTWKGFFLEASKAAIPK
jgi:hypothetical protein